MLVVIALILAGFFAGTTAVLVYLVRELQADFFNVNIERKRLFNKLFIREGHAQLFPDSEIEPDTHVPSEKRAALTTVSPLRRGVKNLRQTVDEGKKEEAGSNLPEPVKAKIAAAAENARNGTS